jgi:Biotin and Thiamin Synthesis associated domain
MRHAEGSDVSDAPPFPVDDANFKKLVAILRIAVPYTGMILSTRVRNMRGCSSRFFFLLFLVRFILTKTLPFRNPSRKKTPKTGVSGDAQGAAEMRHEPDERREQVRGSCFFF